MGPTPPRLPIPAHVPRPRESTVRSRRFPTGAPHGASPSREHPTLFLEQTYSGAEPSLGSIPGESGRMAPWLCEGPANEAAFDALITALSEGSAMALVGAGSSARVGFPLWTGLLDRLATAVSNAEPRARSLVEALATESDLLWKAEELRRLLGDDAYHHLVRTLFGPEEAPIDDFHDDLVRLPFRHVLTTNYDAVLEQAHVGAFRTRPVAFTWNETANMRELVQRIGDDGYGRRYVYLHGRFDQPEDTILTERDYAARFLRSGDTLPKLFALLATQRLVSIGFSLADMDLMGVFRHVHTHMGAGEARHFAILPLDPASDPGVIRRRLLGKYGVEPVFYPATPDHRGLPDLVRELLRAVRPSAVSLPPDAPRAPVDTRGPLPPTAGYDQRCYVPRPSLERQVDAGLVSPGTPVVLLGPSRFGKTALLEHVIDVARRADHAAGKQTRLVRVALDAFEPSVFQVFDDFLYELGCHLVSGVDGDPAWLEEAWDLSGSAPMRIEALLKRHVLHTVNGRLFVAIEGLGELHRTGFASAFLGVLRSWAQNASHPAWSRLRLVLTVSTEPSLFREEIHRSPFFNATLLVRLPDLSLDDILALRTVYGLPWDRAACEELMDKVGGHPYLCRTAMFQAATTGQDLRSLLERSHEPGGIFEPFLAHLWHDLTPELQQAVVRILTESRARLALDVEDRLRGAGFVRGGPGNYRLRYALYETYVRDVCMAPR